MSTVKTTTLSTLDGTYTVPAETLARGACRAWVNFNGTGTVAIRASFNVSSITDNGTGDYTVNFTTAMPDADYAVTSMSRFATFSGLVDGSATTNSCQIGTASTAGVDIDRTENAVAIFR